MREPGAKELLFSIVAGVVQLHVTVEHPRANACVDEHTGYRVGQDTTKPAAAVRVPAPERRDAKRVGNVDKRREIEPPARPSVSLSPRSIPCPQCRCASPTDEDPS